MRTPLLTTLCVSLLVPSLLLSQELGMDDLNKVAAAPGTKPSVVRSAPRYGSSYRQDILDILKLVEATKESIAATQKAQGAREATSALIRASEIREEQERAWAARSKGGALKLVAGLALLGTAVTIGAYDREFNGGSLTRSARPALQAAGAAAASYGMYKLSTARAPDTSTRAVSAVSALPATTEATLTVAAIERLEAEGGSHLADLAAYQEEFTAKVNQLMLASHKDPASRIRVQAASLVFGAPARADASVITALIFQVDGQLVTVTLDQLESYLKDDFRSLIESRRAAVEDATLLTLPDTYVQMEAERLETGEAKVKAMKAELRKLGFFAGTPFQPFESAAERALRKAKDDLVVANRETEHTVNVYKYFDPKQERKPPLLEQLEILIAKGASIQAQATLDLRRAEKAAELLRLLDKERALGALAKIRRLV